MKKLIILFCTVLILFVSCVSFSNNDNSETIWVANRTVSVDDYDQKNIENYIKTLYLTAIKSNGKYLEEKPYSIFIGSDCVFFDMGNVHEDSWLISVITENGYYEYTGTLNNGKVYCYNERLYSNFRVGCSLSMKPKNGRNINYYLGNVNLSFDYRNN